MIAFVQIAFATWHLVIVAAYSISSLLSTSVACVEIVVDTEGGS